MPTYFVENNSSTEKSISYECYSKFRGGGIEENRYVLAGGNIRKLHFLNSSCTIINISWQFTQLLTVFLILFQHIYMKIHIFYRLLIVFITATIFSESVLAVEGVISTTGNSVANAQMVAKTSIIFSPLQKQIWTETPTNNTLRRRIGIRRDTEDALANDSLLLQSSRSANGTHGYSISVFSP